MRVTWSQTYCLCGLLRLRPGEQWKDKVQNISTSSCFGKDTQRIFQHIFNPSWNEKDPLPFSKAISRQVIIYIYLQRLLSKLPKTSAIHNLPAKSSLVEYDKKILHELFAEPRMDKCFIPKRRSSWLTFVFSNPSLITWESGACSFSCLRAIWVVIYQLFSRGWTASTMLSLWVTGNVWRDWTRFTSNDVHCNI